MCLQVMLKHTLTHTHADYKHMRTQWVLAEPTVFVDVKMSLRVCLGVYSRPACVHHSWPKGELYLCKCLTIIAPSPAAIHISSYPRLLPLLALSTTLWSPASCEWSIMTGSRTQGMMGPRPRWQQSPGRFFKRQRSTSEQRWGRFSEVREAQATPQGE